MHRHVIVSFGKDSDLEYRLLAADLAGITEDGARDWFGREFEALECDIPNPIGKVLLADLILSVAKYSGEQRFKDDPAWAGQFARNAAVLLGRELIRVDVGNYMVGY